MECPVCNHVFKIVRRELVTATLEQLLQLKTVTWDGNLINKSARDELVWDGYIFKKDGHNFLTSKGVEVLSDLGYLKPKRRRE